MTTLDLIGYKRETLNKAETKKIRLKGHVPCVLYGLKNENIHFHVPAILFKELIYTQKVNFINMDIEGDEYSCILQDAQFHPVSENILHVDFLILHEKKKIKMDIPIRFVGISPGVIKGGKLSSRLQSIKVESFPQNMPQEIEVSIEGLELGQSVKISSLKPKNYTILNNFQIPIATILIPRSLRSTEAKEETVEVEQD